MEWAWHFAVSPSNLRGLLAQPFSNSGEKRSKDDDRTDLLREFVRFVKKLKTTFVFVETCRGLQAGKRFGETQPRSIADVMELLEFGSAAKTSQTEVIAKFPKMTAKAAHKKSDEIAAFADSKAKAARSNEAFAVLAPHRTQYSKLQPHLTLGTIISAGTGKKRRYWLWLQPRKKHCNE